MTTISFNISNLLSAESVFCTVIVKMILSPMLYQYRFIVYFHNVNGVVVSMGISYETIIEAIIYSSHTHLKDVLAYNGNTIIFIQLGYSLQLTERCISNMYILLNSLLYNGHTWNIVET